MRKAYNIKYKALNFSELYDRIKSVAIFGHSLGETDHTYFNKLFQESCMYNKFSTNNNKEFWLFYYKENGYHCMMQQLDSLTHNSLTSFRQYNRVNFINTVPFTELENGQCKFDSENKTITVFGSNGWNNAIRHIYQLKDRKFELVQSE